MNAMYRMITFDMDGTLLSSAQTITEKTSEAIHRACTAGKTVALCTGRSVSELKDYVNQLSDVRYAICVSGALVYDLREQKKLYSCCFPEKTVAEALILAGQEDTMVQFLEADLIAEKEKSMHADRYQIGEYIPLFARRALLVDDIRAYFAKARPAIAKINIYHRDTEARERTRERILAAGLPVTVKDSEITSLELSAPGINKGTGLQQLCSLLGISAAETISVGDAANDLDVLMTAGLPIAVDNAWPVIKSTVLARGGAVVADNDHDGCAEAIDRYLLGNFPQEERKESL